MAHIIDLRQKSNNHREEQLDKDESRIEENKQTEILSVSWQAPEYEHFEKSPDWYWAVAIISLGFLTLAYILGNFILGGLIFLLGFVIMLLGAKRPKIIKFSIDYRGIGINNRLYLYEHLKYFWLNYDPPKEKELIVVSKKLFIPRIHIHLAENDPNKIREFLIRFLEEKYEEPSFIDAVAKLLKF